MDNRIENADQMLTQDIENFSTSLSTLYSNITKPLVDVVVFYHKIVSKFGLKGFPPPPPTNQKKNKQLDG